MAQEIGREGVRLGQSPILGRNGLQLLDEGVRRHIAGYVQSPVVSHRDFAFGSNIVGPRRNRDRSIRCRIVKSQLQQDARFDPGQRWIAAGIKQADARTAHLVVVEERVAQAIAQLPFHLRINAVHSEVGLIGRPAFLAGNVAQLDVERLDVEIRQQKVGPLLRDRYGKRAAWAEIGELEAFNTDGLRSLIYTMGHIPDMKEKTLRYPGHISLVIAMQQAGFFDTTALRFGETDVTPLDFTSRLLVNQWKLNPEEEEFTILKIIIKGEGKIIEYDLLDRYDTATQTSSMARTTGYTCTAAVNLLAKKLFKEEGIFPPELIGKNKKCFDFVMQYLEERNVRVKKNQVH